MDAEKQEQLLLHRAQPEHNLRERIGCAAASKPLWHRWTDSWRPVERIEDLYFGEYHKSEDLYFGEYHKSYTTSGRQHV